MDLRKNPALKVFTQLWLGEKPQTDEPNTKLGFVVPYTGDAACTKRRRTVAEWLGRHSTGCERVPREEWDDFQRVIDNEPRPDFRVTSDVRRVYWGGGNVVWRVRDPRGFELEVPSSNLFALIQTVGIAPGGEVNGECVWARDGAANVLLPVTSPEYATAIHGAEGVKTVRSAEREPGRAYALTDGREVVYAGVLWLAPWVQTTGPTSLAPRSDHSGRVAVRVTDPSLPGGHAIYGYASCERFAAERAEKFEVVLTDDEKGKPVAVAYRKAPLLRPLATARADVAADPVGVVSGLKLVLAGKSVAARSHHGYAVFAADPGALAVATRPLRDDELATAIASIEAIPYYSRIQRDGDGPTDGSLTNCLGPYPAAIRSTLIIAIIGPTGGLFSLSRGGGHTVKGAPPLDVLTPLEVDGHGVRRYAIYTSDHHNHGTRSGLVDGILSKPLAPDQVAPALRALHEQGRILVVTLAPENAA